MPVASFSLGSVEYQRSELMSLTSVESWLIHLQEDTIYLDKFLTDDLSRSTYRKPKGNDKVSSGTRAAKFKAPACYLMCPQESLGKQTLILSPSVFRA